VAEDQPVIRNRSEQERDRYRGKDQAGQVQVSLAVSETGKSVRERQGEQEAEQDLNAQSGYPQLLEKLR
jgi:hypothetical protein